MPKNLKIAWIFYFVVLVIFAVFAYGLAVPNLVLNNSDLFWQFQTTMWHTFYNQRDVLTHTYLALLAFIFVGYFLIICQVMKPEATLTVSTWKKYAPWLLLLLVPLWFGYNALSADIFNYIFNARMIVLYHADPYQRVALDFPDDPWTRFMHNTHTFSPYGYGWTAFSVLLYVIGLGKFLWTWLIFKGSATLSLLILSLVYGTSFDKSEPSVVPVWSFLLVMLNPLMLLEYGLTGHNDMWMMLLALLSFRLISRKVGRPSWLALLASLCLLGASATLKFATELLLPIWLLVVVSLLVPHFKWRKLVQVWWPVLAAVAMFLPLMMARSQYFNPWYLGWSFIWLPLFPWQVTQKWLKSIPELLTVLLVCFSITSLLRYIPWLMTGGYGPVVMNQEYLITWSAVPIGLGAYGLWRLYSLKKNH